ncbi:hypothetical protein CLOM_g12892 [Closterium sp. NIES-68]|nr:hypothetical protein CLOM_g12892 [Closterium sp. NIES-68]
MEEMVMDGYLYRFGSFRSGEGTYCQLTFCVLRGRYFAQFRNKEDEIPLREGLLDGTARVEDTGRKVVNGQVLYTMRLYGMPGAHNATDEDDLSEDEDEDTESAAEAALAAVTWPAQREAYLVAEGQLVEAYLVEGP